MLMHAIVCASSHPKAKATFMWHSKSFFPALLFFFLFHFGTCFVRQHFGGLPLAGSFQLQQPRPMPTVRIFVGNVVADNLSSLTFNNNQTHTHNHITIIKVTNTRATLVRQPFALKFVRLLNIHKKLLSVAAVPDIVKHNHFVA